MQKSEIKNKIYESLDHSGLDTIVICGYDNIHYLSGADLQFAAYRTDHH